MMHRFLSEIPANESPGQTAAQFLFKHVPAHLISAEAAYRPARGTPPLRVLTVL